MKTNKKNLTKIDIIKNINKQFSLPSKFSEKLINDTFNLIIEMVLKSKKVKIKNFGTFSFLEKNSRQGRNPKTKELFLIINASNKCVAPHGLITNICYFLDKKSVNLFNYQATNFNYHFAKISFSEWYANMKINFIFLKKDIEKTLNKINKYL